MLESEVIPSPATEVILCPNWIDDRTRKVASLPTTVDDLDDTQVVLLQEREFSFFFFYFSLYSARNAALIPGEVWLGMRIAMMGRYLVCF